jgi:hypothetical protein
MIVTVHRNPGDIVFLSGRRLLSRESFGCRGSSTDVIVNNTDRASRIVRGRYIFNITTNL